MPLAAGGRQHAEIDLAAAAAKRIGQFAATDRAKNTLSLAATSHVTGTRAVLPNSPAAAISVCGAQT